MSFISFLLAGSVLGQIAIGVVMLAAAPAPENWSVWIGQGGIAAVLAFILVKLEPRLKSMEDKSEARMKSIEDSDHLLARSFLILSMAIRGASDSTKETAREELRKIDAKYPHLPKDEQ